MYKTDSWLMFMGCFPFLGDQNGDEGAEDGIKVNWEEGVKS